MNIYEGAVVFLESDTYYGEPFNEDGVSLRRSRIGHTMYRVNGRRVDVVEFTDAVERMLTQGQFGAPQLTAAH
jgi:hypothetical protein